MITKVENTIEAGEYETILKCSWVYSGFPTHPDIETAAAQADTAERRAQATRDRVDQGMRNAASARESGAAMEADPEAYTGDVQHHQYPWWRLDVHAAGLWHEIGRAEGLFDTGNR